MYVKIITYFLSFFDKVNKNKIIEFFKKNITEDIVNFIDVGAHHAETVKLFDKELIIKNFFCFECSPLNFKFLIKEIKRMNKSSVKSYNYALGEEKKTMIFNQSIESQSSSLIKLNKDSKYFLKKKKFLTFFNFKKFTENKFMVNVDTLKNFLDENLLNKIKILKIDTEGYDFNVIKGLKDRIKDVEYIYFEHHFHNMLDKNYNLSDVHDYLIKNGFKKVFKIKMRFRKTFEYIYNNSKYVS